MKVLLKLLLPIGLGLLAAIANYVAMQNRTAVNNRKYVTVSTAVTPDDGIFLEEFLSEVEIPDSVPIQALPADDKLLLIGIPIGRRYLEGEIVMLRDVIPATPVFDHDDNQIAITIDIDGFIKPRAHLQIGQPILFVARQQTNAEGTIDTDTNSDHPSLKSEVIGPFRIVGIGAEYAPGAVVSTAESTDYVQDITLAISLDDDNNLDPAYERLIDSIEREDLIHIAHPKRHAPDIE